MSRQGRDELMSRNSSWCLFFRKKIECEKKKRIILIYRLLWVHKVASDDIDGGGRGVVNIDDWAHFLDFPLWTKHAIANPLSCPISRPYFHVPICAHFARAVVGQTGRGWLRSRVSSIFATFCLEGWEFRFQKYNEISNRLIENAVTSYYEYLNASC